MMASKTKLIHSAGHHSYKHQNEKGAESGQGNLHPYREDLFSLLPSQLTKCVTPSVWTSHFKLLAFCSENGRIHKKHNSKEFYSEAKVRSSHSRREQWDPSKCKAQEYQVTLKSFLF